MVLSGGRFGGWGMGYGGVAAWSLLGWGAMGATRGPWVRFCGGEGGCLGAVMPGVLGWGEGKVQRFSRRASLRARQPWSPRPARGSGKTAPRKGLLSGCRVRPWTPGGRDPNNSLTPQSALPMGKLPVRQVGTPTRPLPPLEAAGAGLVLPREGRVRACASAIPVPAEPSMHGRSRSEPRSSGGDCRVSISGEEPFFSTVSAPLGPSLEADDPGALTGFGRGRSGEFGRTGGMLTLEVRAFAMAGTIAAAAGKERVGWTWHDRGLAG